MKSKPIYLDYNATTPLLPEVIEAMQPYLSEYFGNPSSQHEYGFQTKKSISQARKQVAQLLGCSDEEVVFTSGGTESNNWALRGVAHKYKHKGRHLITSAFEHPAVKEVCEYLKQEGFEITYVPVNSSGLVIIEELKKALRKDTILISVMHANNEIGTLQPIREISELAHERGILVHTDAAQSVGKVSTRVDDLGVDLMTLAGHKFYAPKGIGALYIRKGLEIQKLIYGADHEANRRAGTENVLEIVGLGKAAEISERDLHKNYQHMKKLRDQLKEGLTSQIKNLRINGDLNQALPNTLSVSFYQVPAQTLLSELTEIAASAGAACHSHEVTISSTLKAIGTPLDYAQGTIRFSVGRETTSDQIQEVIQKVVSVVSRLQSNEKIEITNPNSKIKLTHYTQGLGCACKLCPQDLEGILKKIPMMNVPEVLVGVETNEDAAVYQLNDDLALVKTVDFFTPIVDDPYYFGAIAVANALSDIYAKGAKPILALNIVAFPQGRLPLSVLEDILRGASDKAQEAGVPIVGGHSIVDNEPKYGLAVSGVIHPKRIVRNSTAQVGDVLILTKPIGTGILTTALKRGLLSLEQENHLMKVMATLNRKASEVMLKYEVHACTDVTGFGLLGHLKEMSQGSQVNVQLHASRVPLFEGLQDWISRDIVPGGTLSNLEFVKSFVDWDREITQSMKLILSDAQTSGGLLMSVAPQQAQALCAELTAQGVQSSVIIGEVIKKGEGRIHVKPS